jgi:fatty acid desaturase
MATVCCHLSFVLAPVYLAAQAKPGARLVPLWLWFGLAMNGLLNLMHEAAHYHVFRARWGSDVLGRWILGPLAFADFDGYRRRHWEHHRHLGFDGDTKDAYLVGIRGWRLLALLARCLAVMEAFGKFRRQWGSASGSRMWLVRAGVFQTLFCGSLLVVARDFRTAVLAYCAIYVYGLMSLTVFAATVRAIAEHQIGPDSAASAGRAALRNFSCNPLSRLLFGAYGFAEHATHHSEPAIPYYQLPRATTELARRDPAFAPSAGYISTLLLLAGR